MSDSPPVEPEQVWDGSERRLRLRSGRPLLPPWVLASLLGLAWLAIMLPVGYIVVTSHRADSRAERSSRTACELAHTLGDLAESFDRTLSLLGGETRETAEREMRGPIDGAYRESDDSIPEVCAPGVLDAEQ